MSENPYIPFYTSDFLAGTGGMTASTKGVYITLLCLIYDAERPLAQSWETLARRCGCTLPAFHKAVQSLSEDGKIEVSDGEIWSQKCAKHLAQRCERRNSAASAANERWKKAKQKQRKADATASKAQCQSEPEPELDKEKEEKEGRASALDCLAEVVGPDLAADFIAHRKAIRKPMTPKAGELMAAKLAKWEPPERGASLRRSIENGWTGIFEPPANITPFPSNRRQTDGERTDELFAKLGAELARQQYGD